MLKVNNAASYLPAILLLIVGSVTGPDTVLCLGPAGHSHIEIVVGASCAEPLPASRRSAPRPRDGCPRGSKDYRLGVDTHRNDARATSAALASAFVAPVGGASLVATSRQVLTASRFLSVQEAPSSTIVLRC